MFCTIVSLPSLAFRYVRNYVWVGVYCSHLCTDIFFHYSFSAGTNDIGRQIHARSHLLRFPYLFGMAIVVELLVHLQIFCNPWTVAHQAFLSMWFSRLEYWNGLPSLFPGDLLDPGIEPWSPALQEDSLLSELQERHMAFIILTYFQSVYFLQRFYHKWIFIFSMFFCIY